MKKPGRHHGLTLMEMTVVVVTAAVLLALALPAVKSLFNALETRSSTKAMINAAMASARAIAAREQRYAGIRFQTAYDPCDPYNPLSSDQYMIFVIHEEPKKSGNIQAGMFRAVEGVEPIKLPENMLIIDLRQGSNNDAMINNDNMISQLSTQGWQKHWKLRDTTAFSVIFSPNGKLTTRNVWVKNRDACTPNTTPPSYDDVFNTLNQITHNTDPYGMFIQDEKTASFITPGLEPENSRNSFLIVEKDKFKEAYQKDNVYSEYLFDLLDSVVYICPHTGEML